jgi:hypothetical protein
MVVVLELRSNNYSVPRPFSRSVVWGAIGARGISSLGGDIEGDRIRYRKEKGAEKPLRVLFQIKVRSGLMFDARYSPFHFSVFKRLSGEAGSLGSHVGKAPLHRGTVT